MTSLVWALGAAACNSPDDAALAGESGTTEAPGTQQGDGTAAGEPIPGASSGVDGDGSQIMCDVFAQDCPEGHKCSMKLAAGDFGLANVCVPVGDTALGEACTHEGFGSGVDSCDASSWCFGQASPQSGWEGVCRAWCGGTSEEPSCEQAGDACFDSDAAPVCVPSCDPLSDDCPDGESCLFRYSTLTFTCYPEGEAQEGEPCGPLTGCTGGLVCLQSPPTPSCDSEFCCTRFCDVEASTCDEGLDCAPLVPNDIDNGDVGACVTP